MNLNKEKYSKEIKDRIGKSFLSQEIIESYSRGVGFPVSLKLIEEAEESYSGTFESEKEFAENLLVEIGIADLIPDWVFYCLNFEEVAQELRHDYFKVGNHYFRHL